MNALYLFTNYNAASGGSVVNQVERLFDGLGQMTAEYQSHTAGVAVNTATTPKTQYAYTEASGGNTSRLVTLTYPNGRTITSGYGTSGGVNDRISRVATLTDSLNAVTVEGYQYLGLDTLVVETHPYSYLNYVKLSGEATGDAGDQYTGLDRFGRVVDQRWLNGSNQPLDRFQYGYDADGNALYRDNRVNPIFGELYHVDGAGNGYDGLNQLQQFARGTLTADKGSITGPHYGTRVYAADAAGNFTSETVSGVLTNRTHNAQNELTALGGSGLGFDNAGNTTADGAGDSFSYDAWNRLVSSSKTGLTETYAYDALGRRTTETVGGTTRQLYYNNAWQVLEEEATAGGAAVTQYVWSALGSDRLVLRDRAPSGSGPLSEHFYVQQDVHGDVTALVNTAGGVSERYAYDPYGGVGYLNASWGVISASTVGWQVLFQGERIDRFSLTDDRERVYAAGFERFMQNDPIGFGARDPNTYRFVANNPVGFTDPLGLERRKISDEFPAQIDLPDCYTPEQKDKIQAAIKAAATRVQKAYIALRDYWDAITASAMIKPEGAAKVFIPAWYKTLAGTTTVLNPDPIAPTAVELSNRSWYLSRFEKVLKELRNPAAVIPFNCGEANESSGRDAYVVFNEKLFGLIRYPGNVINTTDRFFSGETSDRQRCVDITHEFGRRSHGLYDENTGDFWNDVYEWDHMLDRLEEIYNQQQKKK